MLDVLRHRSYANLFAAQVIALLGTGLLTVALGLLAFDIAGGNAGIILGNALTIKMVAYVLVAPIVSAIANKIRRKTLLVSADVTRAAIALCLPFVGEAWQIYILIFFLQSASATFTPAFQATIPDVLPDERQYTRALSLARLAYDLEALVSPAIAAALLTVISYHNLFIGTVIGFIGSAILVLATEIPTAERADQAPFLERLTAGTKTFWRNRELRSLLALNLVVATSTAMVIVNTVVLVQDKLGRGESDVAILLAAYGAGSMLIALIVPRILDTTPDRTVMLTGAVIIPVGLVAAGVVINEMTGDGIWWVLIVVWAVLGAAASLVQTPSARLLRRATTPALRPGVFVAQFSLSHACYMLTYPTAGTVGAKLGLPTVAFVLAGIALIGVVLARLAWRRD